MIASIINSDGMLVLTGNNVDTKFQSVKAKEGNSITPEINPGGFKKPKWDGSDWVEGTTALEGWKKDMAESDALIPRWAEDLYDGLSLEIRDGISSVTKNKIVQKKAKRELRPS